MSPNAGTGAAEYRSGSMVYSVIPALVVGMLGFMFWRAAAQMRRDRVLNEREATRGKYGFTALRRARFLFDRAFRIEEQEPEWHPELCTILDNVTAERIEAAARRTRV